MTNYCNNSILLPFLYIFRRIIDFIQIIVPILLLVMASYQIIQMMIHPDEKKEVKRLYQKFIAAAIVFFIPVLVNAVMGMVDSDFSNCYQSAAIANFQISTSNHYASVDDSIEKKHLIVDDEYERGNKKKQNNSSSGNYSKNVESFMQAIKNTVLYAREHNYHYGNSTAVPPTTDGRISCDRLEAKALWDIGYTDQRKGGEVVSTLDGYLTSHGWQKSTNINDCRYGSIVLVSHNGVNGKPYHAFTVESYNPSTKVMITYDEGAEWRIHSNQPFTSTYWNQSLIYGVYNMN